MPVRPDLYDQLLAAKCTPERIDSITRIWVASNHDAIATVAIDMMRKPSGTQFCVPPLSFIGFDSDQGRTGYYIDLMKEYKRCRKGGLEAGRLTVFHMERVAEWLRQELVRQLTAIARETGVAYFHRSPDPEPTSTEIER
jgi:hypothetical protein